MAYTTIDKSDDYFNTKLHTGDGGGSGSSTGIGFQPDMVWSKSRTEALNHTMFDSVRGAGSNKELTPNGAGAEGGANSAGFGYISAFNSDGYSWTAGSTNTENFNKSSQNYANWCWLGANGTSANTDGTISSTVSANTTSGFSIVSYTSNGSASQTVGHGLGVAPNVIISKNRTDGGATYGNWVVYHSSLATANDTKILLNSTAASSSTNEWGDTDPTSTVYSVHTSGDGATNHSSDNIVAYCFAEKKGFSKFGKYTGINNADGPFIYTGFKPAFIMIKDSSAANGWHIRDDKRSPINPSINFLQPNNPDTEVTLGEKIDLLSNGFKIRQTGGKVNDSGNVYIYMAFAENPFVTSTGIPTTAR
jgi:hypothetical protein